MKRWLQVMMIGLLISALAGCSTNGKQAASQKENGGGITEITMITNSGWGKSGLQEVIAGFERENPDIKVKLEEYPFRQLFETIEVKLGSKSQDYDVITVDGPLVANYWVKGYLEELQSYMPSDDWKLKWIDSSILAGSYGGKLIAAPMNTSSQVLFYNKDLFKEKGIEPPAMDVEQRWTWEQVIDAAQKLTYDTNGDGQTDVFGFSFEQISRAYQTLALAEGLGAKSLRDDGIVATGYINSDLSVKAGQFYYDLFNTWKVSPRISPEESGEYFMNGKIAMFIGGTWNTRKFTEANVNYGIAPHPYFADGTAATPTGSWHLAISKYSAKKEAAAKFIEYLSVGAGSDLWFQGNRDLPSHLDILGMIEQDPEYDQFPNDVYRIAAYEAKHTAVPRPLTPGYLEWETLYNKAYEDIKNGTDPKKALDQAAEQMDKQLAKYRDVVAK